MAPVRLLLALSIMTMLVLCSCAGPQTPDTFDLRGQMTLTDNATGYPSPGCHGYKGFDDIDEGTGVTVYDAGGKIVGSGRLEQGTQPQLGGCVFPITVTGVPGGSGFYQVEVSHRGKITTSEADARAGKVAMTLG